MATCKYHCPSCDRHFASERAFDWHRSGKMSERRCLDPEADNAEREAEQKRVRFASKSGKCRLSVPDGAEPAEATIWAV